MRIKCLKTKKFEKTVTSSSDAQNATTNSENTHKPSDFQSKILNLVFQLGFLDIQKLIF